MRVESRVRALRKNLGTGARIVSGEMLVLIREIDYLDFL
jgi:hypothetical protein